MNIKQRIKQTIKDINAKSNISLSRKISVVGLGSLSSLLLLLMVEVLFAQILTDTILGSINDNLMLLIIIIGLLLMTIIIAFVVGYFISQDVALKSVRNASIFSLGCLFLFLFIISNVSLFILYRNVYRNVYGFEILWVAPQTLVLFGIYVLEDVFNLFILTILSYYLFFLFFLENLYISKEVNYRD